MKTHKTVRDIDLLEQFPKRIDTPRRNRWSWLRNESITAPSIMCKDNRVPRRIWREIIRVPFTFFYFFFLWRKNLPNGPSEFLFQPSKVDLSTASWSMSHAPGPRGIRTFVYRSFPIASKVKRDWLLRSFLSTSFLPAVHRLCCALPRSPTSRSFQKFIARADPRVLMSFFRETPCPTKGAILTNDRATAFRFTRAIIE